MQQQSITAEFNIAAQLVTVAVTINGRSIELAVLMNGFDVGHHTLLADHKNGAAFMAVKDDQEAARAWLHDYAMKMIMQQAAQHFAGAVPRDDRNTEGMQLFKTAFTVVGLVKASSPEEAQVIAQERLEWADLNHSGLSDGQLGQTRAVQVDPKPFCLSRLDKPKM